MQLGKLEKVPLREAWKHEALNFTNWLAEDENLRVKGSGDANANFISTVLQSHKE